MAITACHAFVKHSALDERSVFVILPFNLTIGKVEAGLKKRDAIVVPHLLAVNVVLVNLAAPRMTSRAHLDLAFCLARRTAQDFVRARVYIPLYIAPLVERDQ